MSGWPELDPERDHETLAVLHLASQKAYIEAGVAGVHFEDQLASRDIEPETVHGPYEDELHARMEWQRLTFRDCCGATTRYSICVESIRP